MVLAAAVAPSAAGASPSAEPKVRGPTRAEAWVARIVAPARGYARAGGTRVIARLGVTARWAGGPNQLLVLAARHDAAGRLWLRVRLARRPNDANAWIRADRTVLKRTRWRVEIDVGDRILTVFRANRVLHRFRAVVGAPATPTPVGRFAIAEIVRQATAAGFLGPWALHLTAHSDVLDDYGGGPGTVAIHGRGGAEPSRSAWQRPIARLHPDRQPPDPLSGAPPRPRHAGHDPALTQRQICRAFWDGQGGIRTRDGAINPILA